MTLTVGDGKREREEAAVDVKDQQDTKKQKTKGVEMMMENKEEGDAGDDPLAPPLSKRNRTVTFAGDDTNEKELMESMLLKNQPTAYQCSPAAASNLEDLIENFWKKGLCEMCEDPNGCLVVCQHKKMDRVHVHCSYLCQECKHFKEHDNSFRRACSYCFTQNVKNGARV